MCLGLTEMGRSVVFWCLVLAGVYHLSGASVIQAKAWLAPILIQHAWEQTLLAGGEPVKPWPWADTWPVAKLWVPQLGVERLVLAGDSGSALAFGPGHSRASAVLGSSGLAVIGGHRDTHFAFLSKIEAGHRVRLELPNGERRNYRVQLSRIVDASQESLSPASTIEQLLLVTCYPFDALLAGGPLRYVVSALPEHPLPPQEWVAGRAALAGPTAGWRRHIGAAKRRA